MGDQHEVEDGDEVDEGDWDKDDDGNEDHEDNEGDGDKDNEGNEGGEGDGKTTMYLDAVRGRLMALKRRSETAKLILRSDY